VGADRGVALTIRRWPRPQDLADDLKRVLKVGGFPFEKLADVLTWTAATRPDGDDLLDFVQGEAKATRCLDEHHDRLYVLVINAVAGRVAAWGRQEAGRLVQTKRLPADASALRYLTDQ
jgi:hypothetical protein